MSIEQLKEQLFAEGKKIGFTDLELYYEKKESLTDRVVRRGSG